MVAERKLQQPAELPEAPLARCTPGDSPTQHPISLMDCLALDLARVDADEEQDPMPEDWRVCNDPVPHPRWG